MIAVTGGLGFIGSNLVRALIRRGHSVFVVDEIGSGPLRYLEDLDVEAMDKLVFRARLDKGGPLPQFKAVFHQGACTDTMETDWEYLVENNLGDSYRVARYCQEQRIPLIYASSAAIYGDIQGFREEEACEHPINLYAESKTLFDNWVRKHILSDPSAPIVGLRYFNVYGPREDHKGNMASVAYKMHLQQEESGEISLFSGSHGFADGEQCRDFVYVDDVVDVNLWFLERSVSGIFNVGTGRAEPFNAIAAAVLAHGGGRLRYIPFPKELKAQYQAWTQADLTRLRSAGYEWTFCSVAEGVGKYLRWLDGK